MRESKNDGLADQTEGYQKQNSLRNGQQETNLDVHCSLWKLMNTLMIFLYVYDDMI